MKGTLDALYIPVALLSLAIIVVLGYYLLSQLDANPILNSATSTAVLNSWKVWDTAFVAATIMLCIAAMILAYFIPAHPAFIVVEIILIIIGVFIAPIYSNMYATIATQADLNASAQQFPNIAFIIGYMPFIVAVISVAIGLATYGKHSTTGMSGGVAGL
jgi:hypothetical protein